MPGAYMKHVGKNTNSPPGSCQNLVGSLFKIRVQKYWLRGGKKWIYC